MQRDFHATGPERAVADRHHRAPDARGQALLLCRARPLLSEKSSAGRSTGAARRASSTTPSPRPAPRGDVDPATVIHSDHGTQFTSWAFTENVRRLGLVSSMGTVGDCYDNAPMESFWGSMQIELLNRQKWRTKIELADRHRRLHRELLQPDPTPQLARLPHPERVRRSTLTTHPAGHFAIKSGPLNGVKLILVGVGGTRTPAPAL